MGQACSKVSPGSIPGLMDSAEDSRGELILASSQITEEGAKIIASRLTASTLSRLDLGDNLIGDAGAVAICESLSDNLSLKRLVLMGNQLSDGAVELMVNALMPNRHLRDLDLHDNEITAKGAEHLRRLLQRTHHLESLLVGSNSLGDEGVKHLCKGMRKNHRGKLRRLGLSANKITNVGAERLWMLIDKRIHSITECVVTFNDINDYHLLELIEDACKKNHEFAAVKAWGQDVESKQGKRKQKHVGTVDELSQEQLESIKESFRMFDRDGDGTVDATEIVKVMEEIGQAHDEQTLQDMIADADEDGNGVIEEREFIAMMARQTAGSESEDEDDSGDSDLSDDEPADGSFSNPVADNTEMET
jgi:Leucine-rich repeat (LRR) protein